MNSVLHAAPLEWIFFGFAVMTAGLSAFTLRDALDDSAFLRASGKNGFRRISADQNVRGELFRLTIATVMLLTSGAAVFMEPPPPPYQYLPQSLLFLVAWVTVCLLLSGWSLIDKSARHKAARYADAQNPADPMTGLAADPSKPINDDPPTTEDGAHRRKDD